MSFPDPSKSALAFTSLLSLRSSIPEPLDCTSLQVLDLCTRRRALSPQPEGARLKLSSSPPMLPMSIDHFPVSPSTMFSSLPIPEVDSSSEEGSVKSDMTDVSLYPQGNQKARVPRPFKAYPKDPFFLAIGASTADAMLGQESTEAYAEFRNKMLSQVRANNPLPGVTNVKMRRSSIPTSTEDFKEGKDATYWEKRKKNNEAAKRSRDARRAKEDEIAIRAAFLEQENLKLKYEIAALRNETTKLRCLLYN